MEASASPDSPLEKTIVGTPLSAEIMTAHVPGTARDATYLSTLISSDRKPILCTTDGLPDRNASLVEAAALLNAAREINRTVSVDTLHHQEKCLLRRVDAFGYSINVE